MEYVDACVYTVHFPSPGAKFGTVTNSKGYKVLPPYLRIIQVKLSFESSLLFFLVLLCAHMHTHTQYTHHNTHTHTHTHTPHTHTRAMVSAMKV